jgi:predicted hydrolase (HD superfamily)
VNREVIEKGAQRLGMDLGELIEATIAGMTQVADQIGLGGIEGIGG